MGVSACQVANTTNPCNTPYSLIHSLMQMFGKFGRGYRGPRWLLAGLAVAMLAGWLLPWGSTNSPTHAMSAGLAPAGAEIASEEQSIQDPITASAVSSAPRLATISEQGSAIRKPILAGPITGRFFLRGALSWVPSKARGNLRFELNHFGKGDDLDLNPDRFQAPEKILSSDLLVNAKLQEMDAYLIDVLQWIPIGGGKYSLSVHGPNYKMRSRPFLISRADRRAVERGVDKYVTVLPGKSARAWVEGNIAPLSLVQVQPLPTPTGTLEPSRDLDSFTYNHMGRVLKRRLSKLSDQQPLPAEAPAFRPRQVAVGLYQPGQARSISIADLEKREGSTAFFASSLKEGPFHLVAVAEGLPPMNVPVALQLDTNTVLDLPIVFPSSAALAGQVYNLNGIRLKLTAQRIVQPDQEYFLFGNQECIWEGNAVRSFRATTTTDSDGHFAFEGLSPGTYRIHPDLHHPRLLTKAGMHRAFMGNFQTHQTGIEFTIEAARIQIAPLPSSETILDGDSSAYVLQYMHPDPNARHLSQHFDATAEGGTVILVEPNTEFVISRRPMSTMRKWPSSAGIVVIKKEQPSPGEETKAEQLWSGKSGPAGSVIRAILSTQ